MTLDQLQQILPRAGAMARIYVDHLNAAADEFDINTVERLAPFIANVGHESGQLRAIEENLNYSAQGLMATWPKRFPDLEFATRYARQPEKIANYVYANRNGNGDEASGDGWKYRGAGLIQTTFKNNHAACAAYFDIPLADMQAWLRSPEGACRSAGYFWQTNGINALADAGNQEAICRRINGGTNGLADRLALFEKAREVLNA